MRLILLLLSLILVATPQAAATPPAGCTRSPFSRDCEAPLRKAAAPGLARTLGTAAKPKLPLSSFAFNYTAKTFVVATTKEVTLDGKVVAKLRPRGNTFVFDQADAMGEVLPALLAGLRAAKKRVKQGAVVFAIDGRLPYGVVVSLVATASRAAMWSMEFLTLDPSEATRPWNILKQTPFSRAIGDSGSLTWVPAVTVMIAPGSVSLMGARGSLPTDLAEPVLTRNLHTLYNRMARIRGLNTKANSIQLRASWWTPWATIVAVSDAVRLRRAAPSYTDARSYLNAPLADKDAYVYARAALLNPENLVLRLPIPMRIGDPEVEGACSQDHVKEVVARRQGAFRVCYRKELRAAHRGKASLQWRIGADGRTRGVRVQGIRHKGMRTCLEGPASRMRFMKGKACKVTVPLVLQGP